MTPTLGELDACLERLVAGGGPPGAVLAVHREGALVFERAWGAAQLPEAGVPGRPMRTDTIFDLGSITKVVVTTAVVMSLVEAGALDLEAPVSSWLDGFAGPDKRRVTLAHLLTHRAGLWEWWPVYFQARDRAAAIELVSALELRYPVDAGRHYSDLGFMLLGEIVRRVTGEELDTVARRLVLDPLGMGDTCFLPPRALRPRIAATSRGDRHEREMVATGDPYPVPVDPAQFRGWREHTLVGEVNDGNAHHAFGGVAGHAGLFSTARDLAAFGQALAAGGAGVWDAAIVQRFTREHADPGQGLGFWTRRHAGIGFGHGGFPGTELLIAPERGLVVVLLTNRLHARAHAGTVDAPWREVLGLLTRGGPGVRWPPSQPR
jgi:CubicO group peptidase (beta-lactamase class C family)